MGNRWREIDAHDVDWAWLDSLPDRNVFQRKSWLDFLEATQGVEPFFAGFGPANEQPLVFFTGMVKTVGGARFMGSPARGWTTATMGFNVADPDAFDAALPSVVPFLTSQPRVVHVEFRDDRVTPQRAERLGMTTTIGNSWVTDLRQTEEEVLASFNQSKRRNTRLAERRGVVIEEASGESFVDDFYPQLTEVFAKQNLTPTYGEDRVRQLIRHVEPAGNLLLLRARNEDRECIATAIFVHHGQTSVFWANASMRQHQKLFPNEALHWYALRKLKSLGVERHEWGGGGDYKIGYGGTPIDIPVHSASRNAVVRQARVAAERAFYGARNLRAKIVARAS